MSILAAQGAYNWGDFGFALGVCLYIAAGVALFMWMSIGRTYRQQAMRAIPFVAYASLGIAFLAGLPA